MCSFAPIPHWIPVGSRPFSLSLSSCSDVSRLPVYFAIRYPSRRATAPTTTSNEKNRPSSAYPSSSPSWTRPDLFAVALWVLGILSFVFHATLKHATQYGDEIAMLILAGALLQGSWGPSSRVAAVVSWSAVGAASALYLRTGQILHQVFAFQGMILVVGARTVYLMLKADTRPSSPAPYLARFAASLAALGVGYFLWHVDLEMCAQLRTYRAAMGLPWAWLLELHGWWHVLTALGASLYIRLLRELDS